MTRILFWLALALLVYFAIRSRLKAASRQAPPAASPRPARREAIEAEAMLCCAHCGVYYPASENVPAAGRDYCSAAHAPAH